MIGKAREAGSPSDAEQHGFDVVVARVGRRDNIALETRGGLAEEAVTRLAPGLLKADLPVPCEARHVGPSRGEGDAEAFRSGFAEPLLLVGLGPLAVVEVSGDEIDAELGKEMERTGRVGPAAVAQEDSRPGRDQAGVGEVPDEPLAHPLRVLDALARLVAVASLKSCRGRRFKTKKPHERLPRSSA